MVNLDAGGPTVASLGPILPGTGPGTRVRARPGPGPGPGRSPAVRGKGGLRGRATVVVPGKDGSEEAKVLLVAVEGQDVASTVWRILIVRVALTLLIKASRAKQRRHPVAMLISVQKGEVKRLRAAGRSAVGIKLKKNNRL